MTAADKVRENRLRRAAQRQGYTLLKSRRRDPRALDFGTYYLIDSNNIATELDSLDKVEERLTGDA